MKIIKKIIPPQIYYCICKIYDYCSYVIKYTIVNCINKYKCKYDIYDDDETIDMIIEKKMSMARFGDGELKWMLSLPQNSFQENNEILAKRLKEIIKTDNKNILIGIPNALVSLKQYRIKSKIFWTEFKFRYIEKVKLYLSENKKYINTNITRPYICYKNKKESYERFEKLKRIWNNKEIVIIEGEMTKLGIGNDLLENSKKIERIVCPSKNAFSKYNEIINIAQKIEKNKLILISLGPTATILAYDLSLMGYQALDIGHIDIEYSWYKSGAKDKEPVKGKFVNETTTNDRLDLYDNDRTYKDSIIAHIM